MGYLAECILSIRPGARESWSKATFKRFQGQKWQAVIRSKPALFKRK